MTRLRAADVEVALAPDEARMFDGIDIGPVALADPEHPTDGAELVVVLGGDGTILRGAEHARAAERARCSGSTSATSGSSPRPSARRSPATVDRIVSRALRGRGADDPRRDRAPARAQEP